jgi:hypothetical protein
LFAQGSGYDTTTDIATTAHQARRHHHRSQGLNTWLDHLRGKPAVLPAGRNFGRKTQKWPQKILSGRENPRPNFWQICLKMAEKGPNFFEV